MSGTKGAGLKRVGMVLGVALAAWLSPALAGALVNPQLPPPGRSDAFNLGYVDGCRTGFQDAGRDGYQLAGHRDERLYATVPDYKAGYDQAYAACYEEQQRNPRMMGEPGGVGRR